jgi:hypothetical protein
MLQFGDSDPQIWIDFYLVTFECALLSGFFGVPVVAPPDEKNRND